MADDELKVPSQRADRVNDETDDVDERANRDDDQRMRADEFERANDMDTADEYPRRDGVGTGEYPTGELQDERDDDLRLREPYADGAPTVTAEDRVVAGEPITGESTDRLTDETDETDGTFKTAETAETAGGEPVEGRVPGGEIPTHAAPQETILFDQDPAQVQARWRDLQTAFVDDPEEAVQQADALVGEVVDALTSSLSSRTGELRERWKDSGGTDTEQLRLALRDYRVVLERLLTLSSTGTR